MKWFVYLNTTYYPDAILVEDVETPEEALAVVAAEYTLPAEGVAVFPLSALALWQGEQDIDTLETLP